MLKIVFVLSRPATFARTVEVTCDPQTHLAKPVSHVMVLFGPTRTIHGSELGSLFSRRESQVIAVLRVFQVVAAHS